MPYILLDQPDSLAVICSCWVSPVVIEELHVTPDDMFFFILSMLILICSEFHHVSLLPPSQSNKELLSFAEQNVV